MQSNKGQDATLRQRVATLEQERDGLKRQLEVARQQLDWLHDRLMQIDEFHSNAIGLPHGWTDLRDGVDAARAGEGK